MALHEKQSVVDALDDVFASADLSTTLPKYKIPENECDPRHAFQTVRDELLLDGNSRQNLATFCQTWLDEEIHKIMDLCLDKNMIDRDEYPQTAELEMRCVHILADLWNSPQAENMTGCSTTGSSEAAMLGGMAMLWHWRARMKAQGKPIDKPNFVCGPVQVCWHKFARYWDVEIREIPMTQSRLIMSPETAIARCDENTIGVVPTLGVTYTGQYEPVAEVCAALDTYQADTGIYIPVHVDGASGGFLAPFCSPDLAWDFRLERVVSINASGHKFGLAPLGVGWILWRDKTHVPKDLIFYVNYLGGNMPTFALNFSRPAGQIIAQYYNFLRLGREGYRKIQQSCYDTSAWLGAQINTIGPFETVYDGQGGIPALCWKLKDGTDPGFTLYDLSDKLRTRGWQVPAYSMAPDREELVVCRVLVRHGVSRDLAALLLTDIQKAVAHFAEHPVTDHMTKEQAGGYQH